MGKVEERKREEEEERRRRKRWIVVEHSGRFLGFLPPRGSFVPFLFRLLFLFLFLLCLSHHL